jgi:hypothetical protein
MMLPTCGTGEAGENLRYLQANAEHFDLDRWKFDEYKNLVKRLYSDAFSFADMRTGSSQRRAIPTARRERQRSTRG